MLVKLERLVQAEELSHAFVVDLAQDNQWLSVSAFLCCRPTQHDPPLYQYAWLFPEVSVKLIRPGRAHPECATQAFQERPPPLGLDLYVALAVEQWVALVFPLEQARPRMVCLLVPAASLEFSSHPPYHLPYYEREENVLLVAHMG